MESEIYRYHLQNLEKHLRINSLRNSSSRIELLKYLCNNDFCLKNHYTADDIVFRLQKTGAKVSRASVFRNIGLFSDIGILRKSKFGENHFHYELKARERSSHHHLICKKCEKVIEFKSSDIKDITETIAEKYDFSITDHRYEIFGFCSQCKKDKKCTK